MPVQSVPVQQVSNFGRTYNTYISRWYADSSVKQAKSLVSDDQVKRAQQNYKRRARYALQDRCPSLTPSIEWVRHAILIEAQAPGFTVNEDGEFSSRGLTDRYVAEFCRLNHLKA